MSGIDSGECGSGLRVVFHPVDCGMVPFDLVLHGDVTMQESRGDPRAGCVPALSAPGDVTIQTCISSALGGFSCLISWLEAVTCGVQECAFSWDGEGPDGELRWYGPWGDGRLMVSWTAEAREYGVCVDKVRMVRAFYESFRSYVESDRYDPLSYETLSVGETFALVLEGGDVDALADRLTTLPRDAAESFIDVVLDLAADSAAGYPRRATLAEFAGRAAHRAMDEPDERWWIPVEWGKWDVAQRRDYVARNVYNRGAAIGYGERLRELRSTRVEKWLGEPAQARRQDAGERA